jgi:4-oxalmesaconate hydratase
VIIDCHGHFTTAPPAHAEWREQQLAAFAGRRQAPTYPQITDDELRAAVSGQLQLMDERGVDLTIFSPRASAMGHHLGDLHVSRRWSQVNNDLVGRVVELFPDRFAGVCQLPQSAAASTEASVAASVTELRRCVDELGFVGCNLNPDPSGGQWSAPALTEPVWFPLYEAMVELDVPAMIHVSATTSPALHSTGSHYLNADTGVFMQLVQGNLFERFPGLRLVIPHGGGAVPFHWGRFRGLADMLGRPPIETSVMSNVFFDTCVYHLPGVRLLVDVVGPERVLFGSEVLGAVRGVDPQTGHNFDDTRRYVEALGLPDRERAQILELNARRVYPRLDGRLATAGR